MIPNTILSLALCLFTCFAFAQVEIDQAIELTGADGNRAVRNLESPVDNTDAVNKAYVDGAVSASGGGGLSMLSNESGTAMNFGAAVRYCHDLEEGDFTDWRMPRATELIILASTGGVAVSSNTSANFIWIIPENATYTNQTISGAANVAWKMSDGNFSYSLNTSSMGSFRVRCVR